jgi:hypothetical protein
MDIQANTPVKEVTIQGFRLTVPAPYAEGHVLSEAEAAVLNQTLAENLRNNFGSLIKRSKDEAEAAGNEFAPDTENLQADLDAYVAEYEFGAKRGGGGGSISRDPVERKAMQLAKNVIKSAIQAKGGKIKDVGNDKITELATKYFEQNSDTLLEQARNLVEAEETAKANVGSVDLDLG